MKVSSPLRVGVLGLTHDHVWGNLQDLRRIKGASLVAVADANAALRDRAHKEFGCVAYADAAKLLEREELDAVYIFGDNAGGAELGVAAARHGLHILIEKPMAADVAGADKLLAAARNAGVRLMVNWPFAWWPQLQTALDLVAQGKIGRVWQTNYRAAHNGPREMGCSPFFSEWLYDAKRNGGGAFIDYCCYGAVLARSLMGMPARVSGVKTRACKEDITVEDNGVLVMTYNGGLALTTASWTQIGHLTSYVAVIYGTTGTLLIEPGAKSRLLLATANDQDGREVKVPKPKPHLANASAHFVHCLQTGEAFHPLCQDRPGRDAQEILSAGMQSAHEGREVSLPLRA